MITQAINRLFGGSPKNQDSKKAPDRAEEFVSLGFKDGHAFAAPTTLKGVDRFERHSEVAADVNRLLKKTQELRASIKRTDQQKGDLDHREGYVAVNGLEYGERSVDAVSSPLVGGTRLNATVLGGGEKALVIEEWNGSNKKSLSVHEGSRHFRFDIPASEEESRFTVRVVG